MNPLSSELPFHVHNWLIISLKDFCIVIRKSQTFWPSRLVLFQNRHNRHNVQDIAFLRIHSSVKRSLETVFVKKLSKLRKRRFLNG